MREFRHAAAETLNQLVEEARRTDRRITKLGTDMSLPDADFLTLLHEYENDINQAGIRACIFGHTVENHLHVNLLPKDYEEYEKGKELIRTWAVRLKEKGGEIVCEHGIGKLKRDLLKEILSESEIQKYRNLKEKMDPCNVWNQGNIFR
jgi:D-lactate dehydrogenase (cytochrome)